MLMRYAPFFLLLIAKTGFTQNNPGPRDHFAMVYNADRNSIVLYGGSYTNGDGNYLFSASTWEWKKNKWYLLDTGAVIKEKASHVMVYDRNNKSIVLFGGIKPGALLADTWLWKDNQWTKAERNGPGSRHSSMMAYFQNNVLLFSGHKREGTFDTETWGWNGENWALKTTTGAAGRSRAGYCVDKHRGKIILFGGFIRGKGNVNDMWEWDGEKWDSIPQPDVKPSPRSNFYMVYDESRRKTVLFGGSVNEDGKFKIINELWEWDGKKWENINYESGPGVREMYGMVYHEKLKKIILYGGRSGDPVKTKGDMWSWDGKKWKLIK